MAKFFWFFVISCRLLTTPLTVTAQNEQNLVAQDHQAAKNSIIQPPSILTILMLTIATELLIMVASNTTQQNVLDQLKPQKLLKNLACEYATHASTTLLHELGHTIAARLLNGQGKVIHLGAYRKKALIDLGLIKIDGLNPCAGLTVNTNIQAALEQELDNLQHNAADSLATQGQPQSRFKTALFLLAGGSTAIIFHYLIKFLLATLIRCATNNEQPLKRTWSIDPIVVEQLITMLWPIEVQKDLLSDGGKLWQDCLGIQPKIVNAASAYTPALTYASEVALAYKMAEGQQPAAIDLLIIALFNQNLRGYLRFTA